MTLSTKKFYLVEKGKEQGKFRGVFLNCESSNYGHLTTIFFSFFRLVLEKQEKFDGHQQFFAIVQLIGTRKQAENFAYR